MRDRDMIAEWEESRKKHARHAIEKCEAGGRECIALQTSREHAQRSDKRKCDNVQRFNETFPRTETFVLSSALIYSTVIVSFMVG
ncbi:hypothetical protein LFL96_33825 [Paraburkholderia sp. D15]|uniref:hypothetical protein n=1 Tax=Paraburkholderia sp. D15 TaxID=2880218 RepID=UPI0024794654|nr:hypothetical protein [Paraburkholderia sp. D15]WGS53148.1 hypothetical protein LFL96_33825 [Paraburkholderia sp. D15]